MTRLIYVLALVLSVLPLTLPAWVAMGLGRTDVALAGIGGLIVAALALRRAMRVVWRGEGLDVLPAQPSRSVSRFVGLTLMGTALAAWVTQGAVAASDTLAFLPALSTLAVFAGSFGWAPASGLAAAGVLIFELGRLEQFERAVRLDTSLNTSRRAFRA